MRGITKQSLDLRPDHDSPAILECVASVPHPAAAIICTSVVLPTVLTKLIGQMGKCDVKLGNENRSGDNLQYPI